MRRWKRRVGYTTFECRIASGGSKGVLRRIVWVVFGLLGSANPYFLRVEPTSPMLENLSR